MQYTPPAAGLDVILPVVPIGEQLLHWHTVEKLTVTASDEEPQPFVAVRMYVVVDPGHAEGFRHVLHERPVLGVHNKLPLLTVAFNTSQGFAGQTVKSGPALTVGGVLVCVIDIALVAWQPLLGSVIVNTRFAGKEVQVTLNVCKFPVVGAPLVADHAY